MPAARSTDHQDYQAVPRPVAAMAKSFEARAHVPQHAHPRDQLLYAVEGVTRVSAERATWIVPPDRALYIPAGVAHAVTMRGRVEMRTLYIEAGAAPDLPGAPVVIEVSELLRALILALLAEPVLYDQNGRGGALAALILSEIARAPALALEIPMPRDARLARACERLLEDPARGDTLGSIAEHAGASARTLSRLFRHETGLSFSHWRQRVRFTNALEALVRGEPVAAVARASGYASASAFTAAFRRAMGRTPGSLSGRVP